MQPLPLRLDCSDRSSGFRKVNRVYTSEVPRISPKDGSIFKKLDVYDIAAARHSRLPSKLLS